MNPAVKSRNPVKHPGSAAEVCEYKFITHASICVPFPFPYPFPFAFPFLFPFPWFLVLPLPGVMTAISGTYV